MNPALDRKKAASMSKRWNTAIDDADPDDDGDEVVEHPGRGVDALTAALLGDVGALQPDPRRPDAPPPPVGVTARALGDPPHGAAHHEARDAGDEQRADERGRGRRTGGDTAHQYGGPTTNMTVR